LGFPVDREEVGWVSVLECHFEYEMVNLELRKGGDASVVAS
jgi:hypothetical protein